jgi:hypothetical protein
MEALFGKLVEHDECHGKPAALLRTAALWDSLYAEPYVPEWLTADLLAPFVDGPVDPLFARPSPRGGGDVSQAQDVAGPSWEEVRAGVSVSKELVIEDGNWLPNLRSFLDQAEVSPPREDIRQGAETANCSLLQDAGSPEGQAAGAMQGWLRTLSQHQEGCQARHHHLRTSTEPRSTG